MAEKQCPACKKMIDEDARVCPYCRNKFGLTWLVKIFFILLVLGFIGYLSAKKEDLNKNIPSSSYKPVIKLELQSWHWYESYGHAIVEGEVKNISDESIKNVVVVATFYDSKGNFISYDSALIEYNPILPNQTSPFKVYVRWNYKMKKASIRFKEIIGGSILHKYKTSKKK